MGRAGSVVRRGDPSPHVRAHPVGVRATGWRRRAALGLLPAVVVMTLWGCGQGGDGAAGAGGARVEVLAASSLTDVFEEVAARLAAADGPDVRVRPGGSAQLVSQVESGAEVDVLATADEPTMRRAVEAGALVARPVVFATNHLAIAVAPGNPAGVAGLADLARADLVVSLAAPEVPAGSYTRQALRAAGVTVEPATEELSVRAVLGKVILGEVDAGVVYRSDALAAGSSVDVVEIPDALNVTARYYVAVGAGGPSPGASTFVEFLMGDEGRRLLARFGFGPP